VPLARLGQTVAEAWLAHGAGASIDQCWDGSEVGEYSVGGRMTTICTIVIRADDGVRYSELSSARDALRAAGFTEFALMRSNQREGAVVFDYHLPLNPAPIRLQGVSPTIVRIMCRQTQQSPSSVS
jgi:hypothetical protein